ncbi:MULTISPECIES: nitroreductase/quinone reductase family protein [Streptacidiphilus]|uniref:Nitroreductase/quinone reductase family protein n=1 Tax=Streptacidiphilus cavernicola TaxID=3342716 RepID=A0ABV6V1M0_9ACTN|nr:nitroreductase/quinone reductase family protein [Streptacidiphilus jeojiense]
MVLEVSGRDTQTGAYHLASGLGPTAQWYWDIQYNPQVTIQVGRHRLPVVAHPMTPEDFYRIGLDHLPFVEVTPEHPSIR